MALQKTLNFDSEFGDAFVDVTDAFIYIKSVRISRDRDGVLQMGLLVDEYVDRAAKDAGAQPIGSKSYSRSLPAGWQNTLETDMISAISRYSSATQIADDV
jgi:hypothetical protein